MAQRYPYAPSGQHLSANGWLDCRFDRIDMDTCFGISDAMHAFFRAHGCCARCGGSLEQWDEHEACLPIARHSRFQDESLLVIKLPWKAFESSATLRIAETRKTASFDRARRSKAAVGARTRKEVRSLLDLQERHCYYCFQSLSGPAGTVNGPTEPVTCHQDHYVALRHGGGHAISNVVLACVSCDTRKRDMHGDDFAREALEDAKPGDRKGLMRIQLARRTSAMPLVLDALGKAWTREPADGKAQRG